MSDPILLFLSLDMAALLALGACAAALPGGAQSVITSGLSGIGALLCLPPLLFPAAAATLNLPAGPPGLSLHLALGAMPACFLLPALVSGTAIAALQAASSGRTALGLAGAMLSLLAADGITLVLGSALLCGAVVPNRRMIAVLLIPLLLLGAVCLLTPAGFAPRFDTIRAAPVGVARAGAAAMLAIAAVTALFGLRGPVNRALIAGAVLPAGIAILIRLLADLSGQTVQAWWGGVLIAAGGWIAVQQAWKGASGADIDGSVASLVRRQAGLMMMGVGLALIARAADLPQTQTLALQATMLLALGGSLAGTAATLAADAIGASAGTVRLARLGGLIHAMPWTSAALSASLLALSALPPGVGFASVWLLLQSLLAAPRTGGLLDELPLVLAALAIALSAAAATSASVRIIGIALLGRPRTPRGAGARETAQPGMVVLPVLAALALIVGIVPGPVLLVLTGAAVRDVAGSFPAVRGGLTMLSTTASSTGYAALPIGALLACAGGSVILALRWWRREGKPGGPWFGGIRPPFGLPFGEPMAQSAGAGFVPALTDLPAVRDLATQGDPGAAGDPGAPGGLAALPHGWLHRIPRLASIPAPVALWLLLAVFAIVLLAVSVGGAGA